MVIRRGGSSDSGSGRRDERVSKLEQWKEDHTKYQKEKDDINEADHAELKAGSKALQKGQVEIEQHLSEQDKSIGQYVWAIWAGIGVATALLALLAWIVDHVHEWGWITNRVP